MINTRNQTNRMLQEGNADNDQTKAPTNKRNAEDSPEKLAAKKRSVFDDLTNALAKKNKNKENKLETKRGRRNAQLVSDSESAQSSQESNTNLHPTITIDSDNSCDSTNSALREEDSNVPEGVVDFDKATANDPFAESNYAMDIFNYYKEREEKFRLKKYMAHQPELSKGMRSILADWLVEVQESFELNHETLYLAMKIIDHFLMKNKVAKPQLQLLGATAVFIACKFDERSPPLVDDFLYICDDAYSRKEMLDMEQKILIALDFDLGIPLAYRFLRRYGRCAKVSMEILTLARFVLETSLMDYELLPIRDSKLAAACLYLALKMKMSSEWTPTLEFYSGYKAEELENLVAYLNNMIAQPNQKNLQTVKTKYSHKVFFEVAKITPLPIQPTVTLDSTS